jgi:hypothetical protein
VVAAIGIYMLGFFHMVPIDFSNLKVFNFKLPNINFYLIMLSILSDNLLVLLTNKSNTKINKGTIIVPLITQFIFMMFEIYQMLLSSGDKLFIDYEFIGFVSLSFQTTSNFVGNLDFVYLFIITMAVVINSSYILSIVRHSYKKEKSIIFDILMIITIISASIFISKLDFSNIVNILLYVSLAGIILLFWFIKENHNARKIKE